MVDFLVYILVSCISFLANLLPIPVATWIAKRLANLSFCIFRKRRKITIENIERAFGNSISKNRKTRIARAAFESTALSIMELFLVRKIARDASTAFLTGNDAVEKPLKIKGSTAVAHLGSEYLHSSPSHGPQLVGGGENIKSVLNRVVNRPVRRGGQLILMTAPYAAS